MKTLLIGLLAGIASPALAQPDSSLLTRHVWRVLFVGAEYEGRLGRTLTFTAGAGLAGTARYRATSLNNPSGQMERYFGYALYPDVSGGIRHYYNLNRRLAQGKSIRYNSGNYVAMQGGYTLPAFASRYVAETWLTDISGAGVSAVWGLQRTYRRNFYLDLTLGVGVSARGVGPVTGLNLGYTFP